MFDAAFAQPLENWFLRGLALVQQGVIHVARLFSLSRQTVRAAQVSLVSEHNEKFCLLSVGGVFHHPRRNLLVERVVLNALTHRLRRSRSTCARRSDGSYGSCGSCHKEQRTKNTPPSRRRKRGR